MARFAASAALLAWLGSKLDWRQLAGGFHHLSWGWVVIAAALAPTCIALLAVRWNIFLRGQGFAIPSREVLRLLWTGQFLNSFMPGAIAGDVYKAASVGLLARGREVEAGTAVLLDRLCALGTLAILALLGLAGHWEWIGGLLRGAALGSPTAKWVAATIGVVVLAGSGWAASSAHRRAACAAILRRLHTALERAWADWRGFTRASLLSVLIHLGNFAIFYSFGRALGLPLTFGQTLVVMPLVLVLSMLPISVNGHGVREVLLIGFFQLHHLSAGGGPAEAAVSLSLLFVANDLLWNLPGGVWLLRSRAGAGD